ncbi:hypothetical protein EGW08_000388, partial [Elysia chlorotica]
RLIQGFDYIWRNWRNILGCLSKGQVDSVTGPVFDTASFTMIVGNFMLLPKAAFAIFTALILVAVLWMLNAKFSHEFTESSYRSRLPECPVQPERTERVVSVAWSVSRALTDLRVDHALCYSSLFGALKYGRMLPTQDHID